MAAPLLADRRREAHSAGSPSVSATGPRGGQILIDAETARRLGGRFRVSSLGATPLKKISRPVEAWAVEGEAPRDR